MNARILVVDDLEKKRAHIISRVRHSLKEVEASFEEADSYVTGRDKLLSLQFDFVILDIMIPVEGGPPSEQWSRQLLNFILRADGSGFYPIHVFGITEHREIESVARQYYDQNTFGFYSFDWLSDDWAEGIASKIQYLSSALSNGASYRLNSFEYDLVVVVARYDSEFEPIKEFLFDNSTGKGHPLWKRAGSYFGTLRVGTGTQLKTALLCIGETGLAPAAAITTQAIQILRPRMVAHLGMCAGFKSKDVKLMDVLIARSAACWQEGKMHNRHGASDYESRGKIRECSDKCGALVDIQLEMNSATFRIEIDEFSRSRKYLDLVHEFGADILRNIPSIHSGLIVSGSSVVSDPTMVDEVIKRHPQALGLDMEIYAIYTAAFLAIGRKCEYLAIKTAADFGDNKKKDDAQKLASELSARIFKILLGNFPSTFQG